LPNPRILQLPRGKVRFITAWSRENGVVLFAEQTRYVESSVMWSSASSPLVGGLQTTIYSA